MEHIPTSTPEREQSYERRPIIDLNQLSVRQIGDLIADLNERSQVELDRNRSYSREEQPVSGELLGFVLEELKTLPARDPEKAMEVYVSLSSHPSYWVRFEVLNALGAELLRQQLRDETRQQAIDVLMKFLNDDDAEVQDRADQALYEIIHSDWINEATARRLYERWLKELPPELEASRSDDGLPPEFETSRSE